MKRILILLIFLAVATVSVGQYKSRLEKFQVDEQNGCAPFTINFIDYLNKCGACAFDYLGNGVQVATTTFQYTTPGNYTFRVIFPFGEVDDILITVDPNIPPTAEVYECIGSQVFVKVTNQLYNEYRITFGAGSTLTVPSGSNQIAQGTYVAPGPITVQGRKQNGAYNCTPAIVNYYPTSSPLATINQLKAISTSSLELQYTLVPFFQYRLEIAVNSTNFQPVKFLYSNTGAIASTTIDNLRVDDFYYCFRIVPIDPCNSSLPFATGSSGQVCSQNFDLTIQNASNKLDWQTSIVGIDKVDIIRNSTEYNRDLDGSTLSFSDGLIDCKINYCYQVVSKYPNGAKSISLEKCGTSFIRNNPTPVTNTTAVVENENALLTWMQDPAFVPTEYNIFKSSNQGTYFLQGKSTGPQFSDATYSTASNSCYKINYVDKCDNTSAESSPICPIRLTYTLSSDNEVTLTWNDYLGWFAGVLRYRVDKYNRAGSLIKSVDVGNATTLVDKDIDNVNQIVSYRVFAIANQSSLTDSSISNYVEVYKTVNLFYPTAFTPDNKGPIENEVFNISGQFIYKLELSIFDRWGSLIFYSDKKEAWDGTQSGQPMPIATYVWTANVTDISGKTYKRSGTVVLLRK
ncbi:MAG: T9SS type B sorting domain-containing protein [Flammeovirgaceae bacterium]